MGQGLLTINGGGSGRIMSAEWADQAEAIVSSPYPHHHSNQALEKTDFEHVVQWMRNHALWERKVTAFYDQFNCTNVDGMLDDDQRASIEARIRTTAERAHGIHLHDYCELTAHRMVSGQRIGIHNDDPTDEPEYENVRVLVFVGRSSRHDVPGLLMLDRSVPNDEMQAVQYDFWPNQAVSIPLGPTSFHAVLEIEDGYRDTLLFSFWSKDRRLPNCADRGGDKKLANGRPNSPLFYAIVDELFPLLSDTRHSGGHLVPHLVGTFEILRAAGADEATCLGGLVHSIDGTLRFNLPFSKQRRDCLLAICATAGELGRNLLGAVTSFENVVGLRTDGDTALLEDPSLLSGFLIEIANEIEQLSRAGRRTADVLPLLDAIVAVQRFGDYRFSIAFDNRPLVLRGIGRSLAKKIWPDLQTRELNGELALFAPTLSFAAEEIGNDWYVSGRLKPETSTAAFGRPPEASIFDYFVLHHSRILPLWAAKGHLKRARRIVHCDSHSDLGKIPIVIKNGEVHCSVTGKSFGRLSEPDFDEMIHRGAITIGNFLTMALLVGRAAELWFISHENHGIKTRTLHLYSDVFVEEGRTFPCIRAGTDISPVDPIRTISAIDADGSFLEEAINDDCEIIFDLDADYFCNRHDDSKLCFCGGECDPDAVSSDIFATLASLSRHRKNIISSTCALSPGFFSERYLTALGGQSLRWV